MCLGDIKQNWNRSQWSIIPKHLVLNPESNGKPLENVKQLNKLLTFCFKNITWLLCGGQIGEKEAYISPGRPVSPVLLKLICGEGLVLL